MNYFRYSDNIVLPDLSDLKSKMQEKSVFIRRNMFLLVPLQTYIELTMTDIDSYVEVFCPSGSWSKAQFRGYFIMLFNLAGHVESKAVDIITIKLKDNFALNCGIV